MTPEQVKAWQDQHGGPGEIPSSPPDSQGLVTHRAADGAWMVVGPSGVVSQGSSPGVVDGGSPEQGAGAPGAASTATSVTNDAQLRAWLDQHGGGQGLNKNNERQVEGPVDPQTGVATKVRAVDSTTVTAPDGATLTLRRPSSGQGYEQVAETPPKKPTGTGRTAPLPQTPDQAAITAATAATDKSKAEHEQELQAQRVKNAALPGPNPNGATEAERRGQDPAYETDEERRVRAAATIKQQGIDARTAATTAAAQQPQSLSVPVPGHPGLSYVTTKVPATATTPESQTYHYENEQHQTVPAPADAPTYTTKIDPVNGQQHVTIIATPKDGSAPTITHFGPDGKPEASLPTEGGGNQGPPLPHLVLGQVQDGLRIYREQLNQQVQAQIISPDVATKRWAEATQMSEMAIKEAQIAQNDIESRRGADVNIRTNALSNSTSGFNSALDFVSKLNGMLPQGSTAGANALIGILGLQRIQARAMGAFDNAFSNARVAPAGAPAALAPNPSVPAQPATIANTPGAMDMLATNEANRQRDLATQRGAADPDPSRAGTSASPTSPVAPPAVQGTPSPVGDTGAPPVATSGQPDISTLRVVPDATGGPPTYVAPDGSMYTRNGSGQFLTTGSNPGAYGTATAPAQPLAPAPGAVNPAVGEPGNDPTKPISMAQPGGGDNFTALPTFNPTTAPAPGLAPPDAGPDMLALQRARIAAIPPWRLSPEDLAYAQQNGLMNEAAQIPGVAA